MCTFPTICSSLKQLLFGGENSLQFPRAAQTLLLDQNKWTLHIAVSYHLIWIGQPFLSFHWSDLAKLIIPSIINVLIILGSVELYQKTQDTCPSSRLMKLIHHLRILLYLKENILQWCHYNILFNRMGPHSLKHKLSL